MHIYSIKSDTETFEDLSLRRIERRFRFYYHWRGFDTATVRSIALNMIQQNHSHLMIQFSNHHHMYSLVHICSTKPGTEVVEDLSLHRIEQRCRFCYRWRAIDTSLVRSTALNTIQ